MNYVVKKEDVYGGSGAISEEKSETIAGWGQAPECEDYTGSQQEFACETLIILVGRSQY
jgi:hypothetical protein